MLIFEWKNATLADIKAIFIGISLIVNDVERKTL